MTAYDWLRLAMDAHNLHMCIQLRYISVAAPCASNLHLRGSGQEMNSTATLYRSCYIEHRVYHDTNPLSARYFT